MKKGLCTLIVTLLTLCIGASYAETSKEYKHDLGDNISYEYNSNDEGDDLIVFNRFELGAEEKIEKVKFYSKESGLNYKLYLMDDFDEQLKELDDKDFYMNHKIDDFLVDSGQTATDGWITIEVDKPVLVTSGCATAVGIFVEGSVDNGKLVAVSMPGQAKKGKVYQPEFASGKFLIDTTESSYNIGYPLLRVITSLKEEVTVEEAKDPGYPMVFDAREKLWVTPVKNQEQSGPCWAFAALGAVEHYYMKTTDKLIDLSENHMMHHHGYFKQMVDTDDSLTIDQLIVKEGGTRAMAVNYLVNHKGPVLEADDPYDPSFKRVGPAKSPRVFSIQGIEYIEDGDRVHMKQAIMDYGGVSSSMYTDFYHLDEFENRVTGSCYYNVEDRTENHQILIVGWDDNYSKQNFVKKPRDNGAWIVKDSSGFKTGDQGYKYVSYEDKYIAKNMFAVTQIKDLNSYSKTYDHEEYGRSKEVDGWGYVDPSLDAYFNRYVAEKEESLTSVGFYTLGENTHYKIFVIKDFDDVIKATGVEAYEDTIKHFQVKSGVIKTSGYHTVDLDDLIQLDKNQVFAVGVHLTTEGVDKPYSFEIEDKPHGRYTAQVHEMETYAPHDWSDGDLLSDVNPFKNSQVGNLCLKAYTNGQKTPPSTKKTQVKMIVDKESVKAKEELQVKIVLENAQDTQGIDYTLTYDSNAFEKIGHQILMKDTINIDCMVTETPGKLRVIMPLSKGIASEERVALMSLVFKAKAFVNQKDGSVQFTYMGVGKSDGSFGEIDNLPSSIIPIVSGTLDNVDELSTYIKNKKIWLGTLEKGNQHGMYPGKMVKKFQKKLKGAEKALKAGIGKEEAYELKVDLLKVEATLRASRVIDMNGNNALDIGDLAWSASFYDKRLGASPSEGGRIVDLDNNGLVDAFDISIIANRYFINFGNH